MALGRRIFHRPLVGAPGQNKSGSIFSIAAATVAQYIETKISEIAQTTKESDKVQEFIEDGEGCEEVKKKNEERRNWKKTQHEKHKVNEYTLDQKNTIDLDESLLEGEFVTKTIPSMLENKQSTHNKTLYVYPLWFVLP